MSEAWYNGLPEPEEDRVYGESIKRIQSAVEQGMSFKSAAGLIDVKDEAVRAQILNDALKVLIARMHFEEGMPLEKLAKKLGLSAKRLEEVKEEMLREVGEAEAEKFRKEAGL